MSNLFLLTRLQLMEALGGVRAAIEKRTGVNGAMAGTAILAAILLGGLGWLGYNAYGIVGAAGMEKVAFDMVFLACGVLTFFFSLPTILSSFFGSSDINDLLPLPVSPFSIVLAKALSSLSTGYLWTFLFIAGPLAGWGIAAGAGIHYWVMYLLAVLLAPLMPCAYAGIISILVATVFKGVRRKDTITTITTVITLAISVGTYFVSNSLHLSEGVQNALGPMADGMGSVVMAFPAYGFAVYALSNPDPVGIGMFVLLSLAAFALFVLVARVVYLRIVTSLSAGGGKAEAYAGQGTQQETPVLKALTTNEVRKVMRNSSILLNYVVYPLVISPVIFGVMLTTDSMGTLLAKMGTLENVDKMAAGFALTALMALAALNSCSNRLAPTSVSREGSNWISMKYLPVPMSTQVLAKVLPAFLVNALITLVIMGAGGYLVVSKTHMSVLLVVYGLVLMLGASWLMTCVGAWFGSRRINVQWGNDGDVNVKSLKGGGAELWSLLVGLVYAALPLLVSPLVNLDPSVFMPIIAVIGVVVAVVLGRVLLATAARSIEAFEG